MRYARFVLATVCAFLLVGCDSGSENASDAPPVEQDVQAEERSSMAVFSFDEEVRQDDPFDPASGYNALTVLMPDDTYRWCYSYSMTAGESPDFYCEKAPAEWQVPDGWAMFNFEDTARQDDVFSGESGIKASVMQMPDGSYRWNLVYVQTSKEYPQMYTEVAPAGWTP